MACKRRVPRIEVEVDEPRRKNASTQDTIILAKKRPSLQAPHTVYSAATVSSMGDYLCIGDFISLYCVDTDGYVFNAQSSSVHNCLHIYQDQDRESPNGIPNVHAITFQVCIQNRYKSNKHYRSLLAKCQKHDNDLHLRAQIPQAKKAARAEDNDNIAEQNRQHGKRVRYGETIQLKHVFTSKYIHISTTQGSVRDKNNMLVSLHEYNAKQAQFRVQPRYKVKSEGDNVQIYDQIVLESVKSQGQYFHASTPWQIDTNTFGSELNLGIERTGFTIMRSFKPVSQEEGLIRGGSCVRLFHRELEAYLVTEGLFDDLILQDVHLRVRQIDQINNPKTLLPSTSGAIYWQIEAENSVINGNVLRWGQQIRLRHMVTRQYLCLNRDMKLSLTNEFHCPKTVFRLHPVKKELDEIKFESYARIEHELTGRWLHALKTETYEPRDVRSRDVTSPGVPRAPERMLAGLSHDDAQLCKVTTELDQRYDDAFSLQMIEPDYVTMFNYVAGSVPFLKNIIEQLRRGDRLLASEVHKITKALDELRIFLHVNGTPDKPRQKLLRNLRVLDLVMELLQFPLKSNRDRIYLTTIFKSAYELLHAYMAGQSRKNALYMAKYIGFFYTQLNQQGDIGLHAAQMVMELIKDNRKVVDKLNEMDIDIFVSLLKKNKNYRYLDMLNVLCVCDGVALPDNQNYICKKWLSGDKSGLLLLDSGLNIRRETRKDITYISSDNGRNWLLLHEFCDRATPGFSEEDYQFLLHQLDLLGKLSHGGNDVAIQTITERMSLVTWDQAFYCLRQEELPEELRAQYCSLIIGLFVNSGVTRTATDNISLAFVYEGVDRTGSIKRILDNTQSSQRCEFEPMREWITAFFEENCGLVANRPNHNLLIAQILRLVLYLVKFGYYGSSSDIRRLLRPLLNLLDGRHDRPVHEQPGHNDKGMERLVKHYQNVERFEKSPETSAIVAVKLQAMEILDLLFTFQYHTTLEGFIASFKNIESKARLKKVFSTLSPMLTETFDAAKEPNACRRALKKLEDLFDKATFFDKQQISDILMDLGNYKYDKMVTNAMNLLNKFYSGKADLFKRAVFSQVLVTAESIRVHRLVQDSVPALKRLIDSRLNEEQANRVVNIFQQLAEFCHMSPQKDKPHPMNQTILINHGILCVIFDMLSHSRDLDLASSTVTRSVVRKSLRCLMFLANGNDHVRKRVYERLDLLMSLKGVEQDVALCLKMAFQDSESLCLKIPAMMIERMVRVAAEHREKAPAVLELLRTLVKVPDLDLPLKRNQMYVMKYIMHNFHRAAYAIDQSRDVREEILTNKYGPHHLRYMVVLVDLLATCAEGENRFIESLCQKFMKLEDVFWVLNHTEIDNNLKSPFLKYLLWVYMNTAGSMIESGAGELPHEACTWEYLSQLVNDVNQMTVFAVEHKDLIEMLLTKPPSISQVADTENPAEIIRSNLHYIFAGVMPFLQVFFRKFYSVDKDLFPDEAPIVDKLAHALMVFSEAIGFLIHTPSQMRSLVSCALSVVPQSSLPTRVLEEFLEKFGSGHLDLQDNGDNEAYKGYNSYYREEEELNAKLHTFAANFRMVYGGENTVGAQLKHACLGARRREYTDIGGDEELPLGEEFQDFVACFVTPHAATIEDKYEKADVLLDQLVISFSRSRHTEEKRLDQEDLDIKCLQLLRAIIHNEERRIPQNWKKNSRKAKSQLAVIADVQSAFNQKEALWKCLPHVARQNDFLVKEVLSFISAMLFNANTESQKSMWEYFQSTREENFFFAIKTRMHISATAAKEKRALLSQHRAKNKEADAHTESLHVSMTQGRLALQRLQLMENTRRRTRLRTTSIFQRTPPPVKVLPSHQIQEKPSIISMLKGKPVVMAVNGKDVKIAGEVKVDDDEVKDVEELELRELRVDETTKTSSSMSECLEAECPDPGVDLQSGDDGYIELVLRVLARMCDGQYKESQDYLREQPDNIKSFNLIAETVQYLSQHYANINSSSINLVIQLLDCLNECIVGNSENRAVVFDNKIVDYVNFMLRSGQYRACGLDKALQLLEIIGDLLMSLVEENSPAAVQIAKEIADSLDKDAIRRVLTDAYHQSREPETSGLATALKLAKSAQSQAIAKTKKLSKKLKSDRPDDSIISGQKSTLPEAEVDRQTAAAMLDVGFKYYFLYRRINDISPKTQERRLSEHEQVCHEFYEKNAMSIELIKDGHLQKVRFRVENKNVLRKEVKEKLKWEVDRSSPSSKIRDLMAWSQDILNDISYQRKVLNSKLAFFFMQFWLFWNYGAILLSLVINILMLATWQAKMAMTEDLAMNDTLPSTLYDPHPTIAMDDYRVVKYSLSGVHNLLSVFVLVSFFLLNHPRLPNIPKCRPCGPPENDQFAPLTVTQKPGDSKLETHLFSFKTLYYFLFVAFSILGTAFSEYFFCFHLLNIVNNNQLLDRVIKAVTTNGKSLLWVGVLGVVIFYIYALIAFAFLRPSFNPGDNWYCSNLLECFVTIVRYGLVGDMFENMPIHQADAYFSRFGIYVIFNVSFFIFITTIGLNIIFGIIVDTFSELRDLKWTAEKDMRDTCFVCSRSSYDFEHYGKGFVYHVRNEHNMWAYIFFFIHLNDTKPTDYTAIELYVHKLLQRQNYDFFPTNRALCLQDIENDQQDSKFDELLSYVSSIFHKQKDEETRKKHAEEREQQQRWEEENRNLIYGNDSSVQTGNISQLQLQPLSPVPGHSLHSPQIVVHYSDASELLTDPFLDDHDFQDDFDADLDTESVTTVNSSEAETVSIQQAVDAIPHVDVDEDVPSGQVTRF